MSKIRLVRLFAAVLVTVCATPAHAEDISTKKLSIKENANPTKRQFQAQSADAGVLLAEADDPGANGASIHVYSATDDMCIVLPSGGDWTNNGKLWKYKNKAAKNAAQIGDGKLSVKLKSGVLFTLADDGTQGSVNVQVQFGNTGARYCMRCGGNVKDDDSKFMAKDCAAAVCDAEPSLCDPSTTTTTTTATPSTTSTTVLPVPTACCEFAALGIPVCFAGDASLAFQSTCETPGTLSSYPGGTYTEGLVCDGATGHCAPVRTGTGTCCEIPTYGVCGEYANSPLFCDVFASGTAFPGGTCDGNSGNCIAAPEPPDPAPCGGAVCGSCGSTCSGLGACAVAGSGNCGHYGSGNRTCYNIATCTTTGCSSDQGCSGGKACVGGACCDRCP